MGNMLIHFLAKSYDIIVCFLNMKLKPAVV